VKRLPNIQILRAVAAMMIVIHHCGIETMRLAESMGRDKLFDEGPWGAGVPLFFAISGFIMVVVSHDAFGSPAAAADFMRRRIIRVAPLYWLVTSAALGAALVVPSLMKAPPGDYLYVVASYLFWPYTRITGDVRPLATPGWTLNLEMMFYVVFAFSLMFSRRVGLALLFAVLGLLIAARVSGVLPGVALNFWGDPIVIGFLFGAAIGITYNNGFRLTAPWALLLVAVGFAGLFHPPVPNVQEGDLLQRLADAIPSALVLIGVVLGPQIDDSQGLWRPALFIGDASYSLYLVHEFLLRPLYLVWLKTDVISLMPLWTFVPVGIAVSLTVAAASYLWFERPVTRWLNRLERPVSVPVPEGLTAARADARRSGWKPQPAPR
jgi:exopolysaccharide production protein ExoZ